MDSAQFDALYGGDDDEGGIADPVGSNDYLAVQRNIRLERRRKEMAAEK